MIQFKRGEKTEDKSSKPLAAGQPFIDTNKHELWIGSDDTTGTLANANKVVDTNAMWLSNGEAIPENADLNDDKYREVGNYYVSSATTAESIKNFPPFIRKEGFILTVYAGNGLGYPCQRLRTLNAREVAERWFNSDTTVNNWMDWKPVSEYSYQVRSTKALERSEEGSTWVPYAVEGSTLCHLPYLSSSDFPETSDKLPSGEVNPDANDIQLFFFCFLSKLFEQGFIHNSYVGISSPSSTGNTLVHMHGGEGQTLSLTRHSKYEKTLPMYSTGVWTQLSGPIIVFGTYENTFYCHEVDARHSD